MSAAYNTGMHHTFLRLLCFLAALLLSVGAIPAADPRHFTYDGTFEPEKEDGQAAKRIELHFIELPDGKLGWTLAEQGRGSFSWPEHFGVAPLNAEGGLDAKDRPAILVQREEGKHPVALELPFVKLPATLALNTEFADGKLNAKINAEAKRGDHDCWEVDYTSPIGYKRTAWIAKDSGLIVEMKEVVFLGPGQKHTWTAKLTKSEKLSAEDADKLSASFAAWQRLRDELNREPRTEKAELTPEQLAMIRSRLPDLSKSAPGPLATILAAAERDAKDQKDRTTSLAHLRTNLVGQELPAWSLKDLAGKEWNSKDLAGKVVVLHFWEYRDVPLEEPYGQVGYVDFLQRRLKDQAVVLGVHVDKRLEFEDTARAAASTAKKLRDFMRLGYPILLDDGKFLKQAGDPRPLGGELPLYVVIGKDGKVVEHHPGMYAVQRERGLEELEKIVLEAAK